ncbi:tigger transposable element-derived protein 6-like [Rhizophagus irregularis DAOM 181602=DAOM 197198]|nr:tigger transposable element-derived protein 6-like [Rhizophagus irregularis DAOM 181602=DAOM 197198]
MILDIVKIFAITNFSNVTQLISEFFITQSIISQEKTLPKRASLTLAQKHEICLKKVTEPSLKNKELAKLFDVSEGCISSTLKNSQKWLEIDPQAPEAKGKRQVRVIFPEIEKALTLWVLKALENSVDISDQVLHEKAMMFASLYKIGNFKGSNGWINGFKKRHNLSCYLKQGEAASAPLEKLDEFRKELQDLICGYSLDDVFNCDETGLYWKMEPKRTISDKPISGRKQSKDRVTILLCSNATDNAPVHALYEGVELTNIEIKFLPSNTTAHLQPCDKGIINSFKAHYRKLLLKNRIKAFDYQQETGNSKLPIDIKKAIKYVVSAWDKVLSQTIFNCWRDAEILPLDDTDSQDEIEENEREENECDKDNIMDVDNINFETLYFNEGDFYNHEECEGFIEYQIDQDSLYK